MTEKVKITQKQANAIESLHHDCLETDLMCQIQKDWIAGKYKSLNELTTDEFIRAIYIGYEVEPEFEEKDYVVNLNDYNQKVYQVVHTGDRGIVLDDEKEWTFLEADGIEQGFYIQPSMLRHATKSEIAREKDRRINDKLDNLLLGLTGYERIKLALKLECQTDISHEKSRS